MGVYIDVSMGFPVVLVLKNAPAHAGDISNACLITGLGRSPGWEDAWRRARQPTPVFLPGKFNGQRSLAGYSPWGCKESNRTEGPQFPDGIKPRPTVVEVQSLNHWMAREFPRLLFY